MTDRAAESRRRTNAIAILVLVTVAIGICVATRPGRDSTPSASSNAASERKYVYLDGNDDAAKLTVMQINIWDTPERGRVVCSLPHGMRVEETDVAAGHRRIDNGKCEGWVSVNFISIAKPADPYPDRQ